MDPIVQAPTVCGRDGNSKACLSSTLHSNSFSLSLQEADADVRRECVLKPQNLGESVEDLIKEYTVCPDLFCLSMMRCNFTNPGGSLTALPLDVVINQVCLTHCSCSLIHVVLYFTSDVPDRSSQARARQYHHGGLRLQREFKPSKTAQRDRDHH